MTTSYKSDTVKENFPSILKKSLGIVTTACLNAGIHRDTYYDWRKSDPEFAAKCDETEDHVDDWVESKLYKLIDKDHEKSIHLYCETRLAKRGYVKKRQLEHSGDKDNPIKVMTVYSKDQVDEMLDAISDK
jgi:hypothetical protein